MVFLVDIFREIKADFVFKNIVQNLLSQAYPECLYPARVHLKRFPVKQYYGLPYCRESINWFFERVPIRSIPSG
jgi:hypothetical protein